ncbi:NAD kinase [Humidisolicoccus flavus]|uniref:NAD kinase n=1 Tax=Humidisolicoccus flavus TaxID=3111414 RepID=UPI00324E0F3A
MSDRRFLIIFHSGRENAIAGASKVLEQLFDAGVTPVVLPEDRSALAEDAPGLELFDPERPVELILTLGGDGTILRAAEWQRATGAPMLGINMGHVGFLAEAEMADLEEVVRRSVAGSYEVEERLTLAVSVFHGHRLVYETWAANEAAIEKSGSGRMIEVVIAVDNRPISSFGTDAVLMSSASGSTAYSFSAGGPIVWPTLEAMLMVPLGAHALFTRPLVVAPDSMMSVDVIADSTGPGVLWCDSRRSFPLPPGSRVEARKGIPLRFARLSEAPFADRLVAKFNLPVVGWREQARIEQPK